MTWKVDPLLEVEMLPMTEEVGAQVEKASGARRENRQGQREKILLLANSCT